MHNRITSAVVLGRLGWPAAWSGSLRQKFGRTFIKLMNCIGRRLVDFVAAGYLHIAAAVRRAIASRRPPNFVDTQLPALAFSPAVLGARVTGWLADLTHTSTQCQTGCQAPACTRTAIALMPGAGPFLRGASVTDFAGVQRTFSRCW